MNVVEGLRAARETYERGDWAAAFRAWSEVDLDALDDADLTGYATAAWLLGRHDVCTAALQRAFTRHEAAGDPTAARCAYWLGMLFLQRGEAALAAGWRARAERVVDAAGDTVERGYLDHLRMLQHVTAGEFGEVMACAASVVEHGRRFADVDLLAAGLSSEGRVMLESGAVPQGLARLDEAMIQVGSGEVSPIFAGTAYCLMIEGCQVVGDLPRAGQWTEALSRWCAQQPGLVAFTGQCAVHRGQLMRLHGALREAVDELDRAVARYLASPVTAPAGLAYTERGDVLRALGDLAGADASYAAAIEHGHDPQPGLAQLWLAQGRERAAVAAVDRVLAEAAGPVRRRQVLPGCLDVLLAVGRDVTPLADELDQIADAFRCAAVQAQAAVVRGRMQLAAGDAAGALPYLRKAQGTWQQLGATLEVAGVRVLVARAVQALGDRDSARQELEAARRAYDAAGAVRARAEVDRLLVPDALPDGLTEREAEVLGLVASGLTNARIAAELVLSEKTVARHLSNIFTKLDVDSRTAAAAYAFEHGLVHRTS